MRCTLGTAVVLAIGFFFVTAIWPEHPIHEAGLHAEGEPAVVAPKKIEQAAITSLSKEMKVYKEAYLEEWDALLEKELEPEFAGLSLQEALDEIADALEIIIVVHNSVSDSLGDLSSFEIERNYSSMKLRTILPVILGPVELTYSCQERVMYIITEQEVLNNPRFLQTRMYDCRDFVLQVAAQNHKFPSEQSTTEILNELEKLVVDHTESWRWQADGGIGSVSSFHGLLLVQQADEVHHKVERFLSALRKPYAGVTIPGTGSQGMNMIYEPVQETVTVEGKRVVVSSMKMKPTPKKAAVLKERKPVSAKVDEK